MEGSKHSKHLQKINTHIFIQLSKQHLSMMRQPYSKRATWSCWSKPQLSCFFPAFIQWQNISPCIPPGSVLTENVSVSVSTCAQIWGALDSLHGREYKWHGHAFASDSSAIWGTTAKAGCQRGGSSSSSSSIHAHAHTHTQKQRSTPQCTQPGKWKPASKNTSKTNMHTKSLDFTAQAWHFLLSENWEILF